MQAILPTSAARNNALVIAAKLSFIGLSRIAVYIGLSALNIKHESIYRNVGHFYDSMKS